MTKETKATVTITTMAMGRWNSIARFRPGEIVELEVRRSWVGKDITVKSGDKTFSPTWAMVMGYKKGTLSWEGYCEEYRAMMRKSYKENKEAWEDLIKSCNGKELILLCYCPAGSNCHRLLLQGYLGAVATAMGFEVVMGGERV